MTKVEVYPGPCRFVAQITCEAKNKKHASITVDTQCPNISGMIDALGPDFSPMGLVIAKPGQGIFYDYAKEHFPAHAACPVINAIIKCVEAESGLGLKKDVYIKFIDE